MLLPLPKCAATGACSAAQLPMRVVVTPQSLDRGYKPVPTVQLLGAGTRGRVVGAFNQPRVRQPSVPFSFPAAPTAPPSASSYAAPPAPITTTSAPSSPAAPATILPGMSTYQEQLQQRVNLASLCDTGTSTLERLGCSLTAFAGMLVLLAIAAAPLVGCAPGIACTAGRTAALAGVYCLAGLAAGTELCAEAAEGQVQGVAQLVVAVGAASVLLGPAVGIATALVMVRGARLASYYLSRPMQRVDWTAMLRTLPQFANVLQPCSEDGTALRVSRLPVSQVPCGSLLLVNPTEKVPLDGEAICGGSWLRLNGNGGAPIRVPLSKDAQVLAGSTNVGCCPLVLRSTSLLCECRAVQLAQVDGGSKGSALAHLLKETLAGCGAGYLITGPPILGPNATTSTATSR